MRPSLDAADRAPARAVPEVPLRRLGPAAQTEEGGEGIMNALLWFGYSLIGISALALAEAFVAARRKARIERRRRMVRRVMAG